jgi:hypothetical protein
MSATIAAASATTTAHTPPTADSEVDPQRLSHQRPSPNIMAEAMTPRPGAAKGVVPKNGIGIAFWIAGVPGRADIVKVEVPSREGRRHQPVRNIRCPKQRLSHRRQHEKGDEEAHSPIGDERACEYTRQHRVARSQLIHHELGDGRDRAAVLHQFTEHGSE